MAEKKRSSGCLLGGCLLLSVVGGALAVVVLAGGAWFLLGAETPAEVAEVMEEPAVALPLPPLPDLGLAPGELDAAVPDAAEPVPTPTEAGEPSAGEAREEAPEMASARSALEEANTYTEPPRPAPRAPEPSSGGSSSSGASSSGASSSGASAPPAAPPPTPSAGSGQNVQVEGPASVVLVGASGRVAVPGHVAPGRYEIEATFPGEQPVKFGNLTVSGGGSYTIVCNPKMAICRAR